MSRLKKDGLALVINSINGDIVGMTVSLLGLFGDIEFNGNVLKDCWYVESSEAVRTVGTIDGSERMCKRFYMPAAWLLPLGDDEGIKIYELKKEKEDV